MNFSDATDGGQQPEDDRDEEQHSSSADAAAQRGTPSDSDSMVSRSHFGTSMPAVRRKRGAVGGAGRLAPTLR
eukprot:7381005-Prymnesium_polylepis.1